MHESSLTIFRTGRLLAHRRGTFDHARAQRIRAVRHALGTPAQDVLALHDQQAVRREGVGFSTCHPTCDRA